MGYVDNSVILKMLDLRTSKYVKKIKKYSVIRKKNGVHFGQTLHLYLFSYGDRNTWK